QVQKLGPQKARLLVTELEHEVVRKSLAISFHRLIKNSDGYVIESREIEIEQHLLSAEMPNPQCDLLSGNDLLAHSGRISAKQSRHLGDGCVENVEDELRCETDREHEQCHRNDRNLFSRQKIGKITATLCQRSAEEHLHRLRENDCRRKQANYCNRREGCSDGK